MPPAGSTARASRAAELPTRCLSTPSRRAESVIGGAAEYLSRSLARGCSAGAEPPIAKEMSTSRLRSLALVLGLLAMLAAVVASPAVARKDAACRSVHLSVASHNVHAGNSVFVNGHVCRSKQKHRRIAIAVQNSRKAFTVKAKVSTRGRFHRKIHVGRAWKLGNVHIRAKSKKARSKPVTVKVSAPLAAATNQAPPTAGSCELTNSTEQQVGMTLPGCPVIYNDTGAESSPTKLWGNLQCVNSSRYAWNSGGGDGHLTATGASQAKSAFRQLTVQDGDE